MNNILNKRNLIVAGAAVPLVFVGVPFVYKILSQKICWIVVKSLLQIGTNKFIIDENDTSYLLNSVDPISAGEILVGDKIEINFYGIRQTAIGMYPTITKISKIHRIENKNLSQHPILPSPDAKVAERMEALEVKFNTIDQLLADMSQRIEKISQ